MLGYLEVKSTKRFDDWYASLRDKGSSSKALSNFAPRELLSITQAKFLCKRLFRVLLKSFLRSQRKRLTEELPESRLACSETLTAWEKFQNCVLMLDESVRNFVSMG